VIVEEPKNKYQAIDLPIVVIVGVFFNTPIERVARMIADLTFLQSAKSASSFLSPQLGVYIQHQRRFSSFDSIAEAKLTASPITRRHLGFSDKLWDSNKSSNSLPPQTPPQLGLLFVLHYCSCYPNKLSYFLINMSISSFPMPRNLASFIPSYPARRINPQCLLCKIQTKTRRTSDRQLVFINIISPNNSISTCS